MTNEQARVIVSSHEELSMELVLAIEQLCKTPTIEDVRELEKLFVKFKAPAIRTDIVDAVGSIGDQAGIDWLKSVAQGKYHYLVRYFAIMNLIELNVPDWNLSRPLTKVGSFWKSLDKYYEYRSGLLSLDELNRFARSHMKKRGDNWEWLTYAKVSSRRQQERILREDG